MESCEVDFIRKNLQVTDETKFLDSGKLLIHAVKLGNEALVKKLISLRVPVYTKDQFGCSPIYYAARYNHLNILKMLVNTSGFDDTTTHMSRSALQIAAYHGHVDIVQYLLKLNADINAVDSLGMSALHWAAENNHKSTVEVLLKSGADTSLVNKYGKSAQRLAFLKNNTEIYELLEDSNVSESLDVNDQDSSSKALSAFLSETSLLSESSILKSRLMESGLENSDRSDPIKLFEQHGIKLLPVDESTLIASALKRGQKAVLTEAGKLALKKTEPIVLYNLIEPSSSLPFTQISQFGDSDTPEKGKLSRPPKKLRNINPEIEVGNTKMMKLDTSQWTNLTTNKNYSQKVNVGTSKNKVQKARIKNITTLPKEDTQSINVITKNRELERHVKFFEEQLRRKSLVVKNLRNQLEVSMKLIKSFKTKYEMKEREASLYKIQLQNLIKMLLKKKTS